MHGLKLSLCGARNCSQRPDNFVSKQRFGGAVAEGPYHVAKLYRVPVCGKCGYPLNGTSGSPFAPSPRMANSPPGLS